MESLAPLFVVSMDLLYHVFIFSAIFSNKVSELNSKWLSGSSENNIDYNNLKAGLHYCGTGCTNAPEDYCRVLCMYSSENVTNDCIQVAYPVLSNKIYMRKYGNPGIWTNWVYFSDDATLNQVSEYTVPKPEDNDDISYGDPCYIYVKKSGRFVNIQLNIFGTVYNTSGFITLFTLNEGYRPISGVIHNYISQGGIPMLLNITTSGNVQIHCPDNTITNSWIIRQCITFPCAA